MHSKRVFRFFAGISPNAHFGLDIADYTHLIGTTESVIHCAASLNRKSEKSCLNVNLRGTLEVAQLARRAQDAHGLRRFSQVSTVAVAGHRSHEVVTEDASIDWNRSDYDPYARTKNSASTWCGNCFPMFREPCFVRASCLATAAAPRQRSSTWFAHSCFWRDSRFYLFARLTGSISFRWTTSRSPLLPCTKNRTRIMRFTTFLRARGAETFGQLTHVLAESAGKMEQFIWPGSKRNFSSIVNWLSNSRGTVGRSASLLKVFMPYLVWDTVFDNSRVVAEMGRAPEPFSKYCYPLLRFSRDHHFSYPYEPWPGTTGTILVDAAAAGVGAAGGSHP